MLPQQVVIQHFHQNGRLAWDRHAASDSIIHISGVRTGWMKSMIVPVAMLQQFLGCRTDLVTNVTVFATFIHQDLEEHQTHFCAASQKCGDFCKNCVFLAIEWRTLLFWKLLPDCQNMLESRTLSEWTTAWWGCDYHRGHNGSLFTERSSSQKNGFTTVKWQTSSHMNTTVSALHKLQ